MEAKYLCPSCRNSLNVGDDIVFVGETKTGMKGIIFLSAELGDYTTHFSEDFNPVKGNVVKYICPICHFKLSNQKAKNKAQVIRINEEGKEALIVFSEIYGEYCTYEIIEDELIRSFGEPSDDLELE